MAADILERAFARQVDQQRTNLSPTMSIKKQANRRSIESGETVYDMAVAQTVASAALPSTRQLQNS
jgi:hypothetical protein